MDRRAKIQSGQRTTSFSFLLSDKRSAIGRILSSVPEQYREAFFMGGQFGASYRLCLSSAPFTSPQSKITDPYLIPIYSICTPYGTSSRIRSVLQPILERSLPSCDIQRQCVEWWWLLH